MAMQTLDEVRTQFDEITSIMDGVTERLGSELQASQAALHETRSALEASRAGVREIQAALREGRAEMSHLQSQLTASVEQRTGLQAQVDQLVGRLLALEAERAAIYDSKSWRITAPLRAVWSMVMSRNRS